MVLEKMVKDKMVSDNMVLDRMVLSAGPDRTVPSDLLTFCVLFEVLVNCYSEALVNILVMYRPFLERTPPSCKNGVDSTV